MVFHLPLLLGFGGRQLRRLYPLVARAISHRVSRQRLRLFHLVCSIRRCWNHLPGRGGRPSFRLAGRTRGHDVHRFCSWPPFDPVVRGNTRQQAAYLARGLCLGFSVTCCGHWANAVARICASTAVSGKRPRLSPCYSASRNLIVDKRRVRPDIERTLIFCSQVATRCRALLPAFPSPQQPQRWSPICEPPSLPEASTTARP